MSLRRRKAARAASGLVVLALLALAPAAADARDFTVTNPDDGVQISAHFFPAADLAPGGQAPTVLVGPGWSQAGETDPDSLNNPALANFGITAIGEFVHHGYNVITWDPRGFGTSGGTVEVDDYRFEGRDVQALLDYVDQQPEAAHQAPGDPLVGMAGGSYGGIIQVVTAAIDSRIDAIVPNITPHDYTSSLFKEHAVKAGWGLLLVGLGVEGALVPGLLGNPIQTGHLDSHIYDTVVSGATNQVSNANYDWFAEKGPGFLVKNIRVPTLLTQGTADTLFTLQESIDNFNDLAANSGAPLKMMWFCGGHGVCLDNPGPSNYITDRTLAWLDRYLKGDTSVDTGPRFEWLAEDGVWRSAANYPLASAGTLQATGTGTLPISSVSTSGGLIFASPAPPGIATQLTIPGPASDSDVVGVPQLSLTYSGLTLPAAHTIVYAQLVNDATHLVEGNQATPIPLQLDGAERKVSRPLEPIASRAAAGQTYTLQLVPSSTLYGAQTNTGAANFSRIHLELPVGDPAATQGPSSGTGSETAAGGSAAATTLTVRPGRKCAKRSRHKHRGRHRCGKRKHSGSH